MSGGGENPSLYTPFHSGPYPNHGLYVAPVLPPRAAFGDTAFQFQAAAPHFAPPHFHPQFNAASLPAPPHFHPQFNAASLPASPHFHPQFNAASLPAPPHFHPQFNAASLPAPPHFHPQFNAASLPALPHFHPQFNAEPPPAPPHFHQQQFNAAPRPAPSHFHPQLNMAPPPAQPTFQVHPAPPAPPHFHPHVAPPPAPPHFHQQQWAPPPAPLTFQVHPAPPRPPAPPNEHAWHPYLQFQHHQGGQFASLERTAQQPTAFADGASSQVQLQQFSQSLQQKYHQGYNGGSSQLQQHSQQQSYNTIPQSGVVAPQLLLQKNYTSLREKRHLEDGESSQEVKRIKLAVQMEYVSVMDFLEKNPPIKPYKFGVGSTFGSIPADHEDVKITEIGEIVLDGFIGMLGDMHKTGKSFGGEFDENDLLFSESLCSVTIDKGPKYEASWVNISKDYNKLVRALVMKRYCAENGRKPAYADEFISLVKKLRNMKPARREITLWIIRHHPLFIGSAKRRQFFEDFYKFYKTLSALERDKLFNEINRNIHRMYHLLIVPKDRLLSFVYWRGEIPPGYLEKDDSMTDGNEEEEEDEEGGLFYPYTDADGYLAILLRTLLVHGPEHIVLTLKLLNDVELEELDLIIAYHFGNFLPKFLDEISSITDRYEMIKDILTTFSYRRFVHRRVPK